MILVNGQQWGCVSALDRGLAYGDGVFRTLLLRGGRVVQWPRQYARLASDCSRLGLRCPAERLLFDEIGELARIGPDAAIKLIVTRGESARGYAPPAVECPTRIVQRSPLPEYPAVWCEEGVRVHVCALRLAGQPRLAGIKHLNRLEQVLARSEWNDPEIAEGLLFDMQDRLVSGTMSNVFLWRDGELATPLLDHCGVSGVTRSRVMAHARACGWTVREAQLTLGDLLSADEVMLTNSLFGLWTVREMAHRRWMPGPVAWRLRTLLDEEDG